MLWVNYITILWLFNILLTEIIYRIYQNIRSQEKAVLPLLLLHHSGSVLAKRLAFYYVGLILMTRSEQIKQLFKIGRFVTVCIEMLLYSKVCMFFLFGNQSTTCRLETKQRWLVRISHVTSLATAYCDWLQRPSRCSLLFWQSSLCQASSCVSGWRPSDPHTAVSL